MSHNNARDIDIREAVVLDNVEYAKRIAARVATKIRATKANREDLEQTAIAAMIEALDRFDPSNKTTLKTFLNTRISGACLDWVRKEACVSTGARRHDPTDGDDRDFGFDGRAGTEKGKPAQRSVTCAPSGGWPEYRVGDVDEHTPEDALLATQDASELDDAIDSCLQLAEREVIRGLFFKDADVSEIANKLRYTNRRIHQIKNNALEKLREHAPLALAFGC